MSHLTCVEDYWFNCVVAEQAVPEPWLSAPWDADPDWDLHPDPTVTGDELLATWSQRVAASDQVIDAQLADGPGALDRTHPGGGDAVSLRWVLVHMVEEYARHSGHADLIRESIDGQTGEQLTLRSATSTRCRGAGCDSRATDSARARGVGWLTTRESPSEWRRLYPWRTRRP